MNDYSVPVVEREKTMIIVEGKHEKTTLMMTILACFPELDINYDDVEVFGTNIYNLYDAIENEYESKWYEEETDINLPLLISRMKGINPPLSKRRYKNIILVFDYEHHDVKYSDEKIYRMQDHFDSATDDGILYINYPMIESYMNITSFDDRGFYESSIPVTLNPGKKYKDYVDANSVVKEYFDALVDLKEALHRNKKSLSDNELLTILQEMIMISPKEVQDEVTRILGNFGYLDDKILNVYYALLTIRDKRLSIESEELLGDKIREILTYIVDLNIKKANYLCRGTECNGDLKEIYYELDWLKVLEKQNKDSSDQESGIIWVLCSFMTFIAQYKFYWRKDS
jgi:hypothetical protein